VLVVVANCFNTVRVLVEVSRKGSLSLEQLCNDFLRMAAKFVPVT
jgi:hypothetical protein